MVAIFKEGLILAGFALQWRRGKPLGQNNSYGARIKRKKKETEKETEKKQARK
jgi:uncharacterized membrane protein affecting hemolysin expression